MDNVLGQRATYLKLLLVVLLIVLLTVGADFHTPNTRPSNRAAETRFTGLWEVDVTYSATRRVNCPGGAGGTRSGKGYQLRSDHCGAVAVAT